MSTFGQNIKEYFTFSKGQRNGSLVLSGLLIVLLMTYYLMPFFIRPKFEPNQGFREELLAFEASHKLTETKQLTPFLFDPNELQAQQWLDLGLRQDQVSVIMNFRNKGGKFFEKEDLKKIYSISAQDYAALEPYIRISKNSSDAQNDRPKSPVAFEPFAFDPNNLPNIDFEKLGLNKGQVNNIERYLKAGGRFLTKEDFKKIYSISNEDYEKLEPYLLLPVKDSLHKPVVSHTDFVLPVVEINGADSVSLQNLKGVGASYAGRIIKYRNKLGGFYKKEQLLEVFGMDTARFEGFAGQIEINPALITKKNINTVEFKELLKHPYLEYYLVKSIFDYKNKNGNYSSVEDLRKVNLVYNELYDKISPYLFVENKK